MRIRNIIIIALLLVAAAGAAYLLSSSKATFRHSGGKEGGPLVASLPVNEVASIEIKSAKYSALLHKTGEQWTVADRSDFPANFTSIANLLLQIKEAKIMREIDGTTGAISRLALKDLGEAGARDDEKAVRVELKDRKGAALATVLFGSGKKGRDTPRIVGWYVRLPNDPKIYEIEGEFHLAGGDPANWLDRIIVNVPPEQVRRIRCTESNGGKLVYEFERKVKGALLTPVGWEPPKKLAPDMLITISQALSLLDKEDVYTRDNAPPLESGDFAYVFEYEAFDGLIYRVYPSARAPEDSKRPNFLRIEVTCAPAAPEGASSGSEDCASRARDLNQRITPWIYQVGLGQHFKFVTNPTLLLDRNVEADADQENAEPQ